MSEDFQDHELAVHPEDSPVGLGSIEVHIRENSIVAQPSQATGRQSTSVSDAIDNRKYRIHLGTRPGSYPPERLTYVEMRRCHEQLIDLLSQFQSDLQTSGLKQVPFSFLSKNAVSDTGDWGVELYAAIVFETSSRMAVEGVAAIIGRIFRQDGIGIFRENDGYDRRPLGRSDNDYYVRRHTAISRSNDLHDLPISNDNGREIMKTIRRRCPHLSGQFGRSNRTIEIHNFGSDSGLNDTEIDVIRTTINEHFGSYRLMEDNSESRYLPHGEYERAIREAGYDVLNTVINMVHLQSYLYPTISGNQRERSAST